MNEFGGVEIFSARLPGAPEMSLDREEKTNCVFGLAERHARPSGAVLEAVDGSH